MKVIKNRVMIGLENTKLLKIERAGNFFIERAEKVDDINYPPLSVTMNGILDQLSNVAKTNDGENRKLVKKDDFVINSRSDRKVLQVSLQGMVRFR